MLANKLAAESYNVAPVRERGLKCNHAIPRLKNLSRSRKGAWIEIPVVFFRIYRAVVAPVRERGLKYLVCASIPTCRRRSRKGAWIEISLSAIFHSM